jgi:hypothetical protein
VKKKLTRENPILAETAKRSFLENHPFAGTGELTITRMRLRHPAAQIMSNANDPDVVLPDGVQIWYYRWIGELMVRPEI